MRHVRSSSKPRLEVLSETSDLGFDKIPNGLSKGYSSQGLSCSHLVPALHELPSFCALQTRSSGATGVSTDVLGRRRWCRPWVSIGVTCDELQRDVGVR
jgi:hypothetical protein